MLIRRFEILRPVRELYKMVPLASLMSRNECRKEGREKWTMERFKLNVRKPDDSERAVST